MTDAVPADPDAKLRWMRSAIGLAAEAAAVGEVPVGTVVVRGDVELGRGRNGRIAASDATAHAEMVAIGADCAAAGNYRSSCATLYSTLEPCVMCAGAIGHARSAASMSGVCIFLPLGFC